ncbi:MAG: RNA polymerase sigma factor [Phycisphaerae bacterium]
MGEPASMTDRRREHDLIARARGGDRVALRALVDGHKDRLYAFIWRMVRNHHDTEEICQDAFLRAFSSLDSFSSAYRFSTWLFTIGYRVCLNTLRRKRVQTGDVDFGDVQGSDDETPNTQLEAEEARRLRETVWSAVERLSPPQRAAVVLFYRHEKSCQDIADVLQVPVATVKSHLHRARARLRGLLEEADSGHLHGLCNLAG